jgi:tetratricopeptide (TPR) repeat protein
MSPHSEHEALLAALLADGTPGRVERRLTRITGEFRAFVVLQDKPGCDRLRDEIDEAINHGDYRQAVFDGQNPQNARELLLALWGRVQRGELDMASAIREGLARRQEDERFAGFNDWYDLADNLRQQANLATFAPLVELMRGVIPPDFAPLCWSGDLVVNAGTALARSHLGAGRDEAGAAAAEHWARLAEQETGEDLVSGACGLWLTAADTYNRIDRPPEAERCYRAAVAAGQRGAPPERRIECLVALGQFLAHAGRVAESRQPLEEAISVGDAENLTDPTARHDALLARAELALASRDVPAALAALSSAVALFSRQPAERWNRCLRDLRLLVARVTYDTGSELADILPDLLKAVETRDPEGRVPGIRSTLFSSLGHGLRNRGDLQGAQDAYTKARDAALRDGDEMHAARWEGNIGQLYMILNRAAEAEEILLRSSSALERHNDYSGAANQQMNVGHLYRAEGRLDLAEQAYADAFVLFGQARRRIDLGIAVGAIGQVHRARGDLGRAEAAARYFAKKAEETGSDRFRATARGELAWFVAARGDTAGAITEYTEAIAGAARTGFQLLETQLRVARARLCEQRGDRGEAEADYRQALDLLDKSRGGLRSYDARASFQLQSEAAYLGLMEILAKDPSRAAEAFQVAEQARSRTLADDLSRSPFRPPQDVPAELADDERNLLAQLRRLERTGGGRAEEYDALRSRLSAVWDRIHADGTEPARAYAQLRQAPQLAGRDAVQRLHAGSPAGRRIILVEYFLIERGAVVMAISSNWSEPVLDTVPLDMPELIDLANKYFRRQERDGRLPQFFRDDGGRALQRVCGPLLQPVLEWSDPEDLIYLVPHGVLHHVPLHAVELACPRGSAPVPLIERNPVAYAPSAATLAYCRARRASAGSRRARPAAVFGDPRGDLPFAELEAREVARSFGVEPRIGAQATADAFRRAAGGDVVHYCGHAAFDARDPLNSGLCLAGEILTARDVLAIPDADAELVVLNGCDTGVSAPRPGDELFGLARAFLLAGAASVLVNLWPVNDLAGAGLLAQFYANWKVRPQEGKAEALRQAVLATRRRDDYRWPYFWGPFVLIGDWL